MNSLLHYGSCPVWQTGLLETCTCFLVPVWRIRKETGESFPWRIWRRTDDMTYEPLLRAASWAAAVQLVEQMIWISGNAIRRESRG